MLFGMFYCFFYLELLLILLILILFCCNCCSQEYKHQNMTQCLWVLSCGVIFSICSETFAYFFTVLRIWVLFGRYTRGVQWQIALHGGLWPLPCEGRFGGQTPSQHMQLRIAAKPSVLCCHLANTNTNLMDLPQRFHLLPDYFIGSYCWLGGPAEGEHIVNCRIRTLTAHMFFVQLDADVMLEVWTISLNAGDWMLLRHSFCWDLWDHVDQFVWLTLCHILMTSWPSCDCNIVLWCWRCYSWQSLLSISNKIDAPAPVWIQGVE